MERPNRLIRGDNLVELQRLVLGESRAFRCAYLDPPYNTGEAKRLGAHGYDDALPSEHWLEWMRPRLQALHALLSDDGSLFIQIDDNEMDYLKLLLDQVFGRANFISRITVSARAPSAFSTVNPGVFKASEYLLWYARDREQLRVNRQRVPRDPDPAYQMWLENPDEPHEQWRFTTIRRAFPGQDPQAIQVRHADQVCRLASISDKKAGKPTVAAKYASREADQVIRVERPGRDPQFVYRGQQLIFYSKQVSEIDGVLCATRPLTNIWTDIAWEGIAQEGGVRFKQGKKPERLLRRVLQLATDPGDWVIDPFLGAGTTAAVAHKMGRSWVGIEMGEQVMLANERLERVTGGEDRTGVTRVCGWEGGGAFTFSP